MVARKRGGVAGLRLCVILEIIYNGPSVVSFFFNDTATTEIYTLSLHDALPIWIRASLRITQIGRAHV